MSRYIDADYLIDTIGAMIGYGTTPTDIWDMVNDAPTIDICFCRDCKHRSKYRTNGNESYCEMLCGYTDGDKYCAWGERKGNE